MADTFMVNHRAEITSLAARHHLPAVYPFRFFLELGGLLSYGNDLVDSFRRAATYADRILKGATPNELPVQTPVKFELAKGGRHAAVRARARVRALWGIPGSRHGSPTWEARPLLARPPTLANTLPRRPRSGPR
jgi:hypothetical protein